MLVNTGRCVCAGQCNGHVNGSATIPPVLTDGAALHSDWGRRLAFRLISSRGKRSSTATSRRLPTSCSAARASSKRCWRPTKPVWDKADEIKEVEHKCDFLTHEIIQRLNRTFVTPLDREDIHALARSLDDVMDAIDAVGHAGPSLPARDGPLRRPRTGGRSSPPAPSRCGWRSMRWRSTKASRRTPSKSTGSRTRPTASHQEAVSRLFDDEQRSDRRDEVERNAGFARSGHRPLRGRRQRPRRRRGQARLARRCSPSSPA